MTSDGSPNAAHRGGQFWPFLTACVTVGVSNLFQHRARLIVACSGIAVALFLLMMQTAFLSGAQQKVTQFYRLFNFDLAVLPNSYQILWSFDHFGRVRLNQAQSVPEVTKTFGINFTVAGWTDLKSKQRNSVLLFGLDNAPEFIRDPLLRSNMPKLVDNRSVLADALSQPDIGKIAIGQEARINDQEVSITGLFDLGLFFYAEGSVIVRNSDFGPFTGVDPDTISIGLIQIAKGANPAAVKAKLIPILPDDVEVLTHDELMAQEQSYFLTTKPIGIMLYVGMIIACLVATVIIIQVLSTEIANRLDEYAVLKAQGFSPPFIYGIGVVQATILGLAGLVPGTIAAAAVLALVQYRTNLPATLSPTTFGIALVVSLGLSLFASACVLFRIEQADPAELY